MIGKRFDNLNELADAIDSVVMSAAEGWYCTEPDDDGILNLFFVPPSGNHGLVCVPLEGDHGWQYTDKEDGLTVTPSIFINPQGMPPGWHGFLTNGVWRTV